MANTDINFNVDPYYDDFNTDKNFHRILFRPGLAVQARELTQLQTILQNQIERIGDHLFKDGSVVNGGQLHLDYEIKFVKLANNETASTYDGKILQGNTSIARARVVKTIEAQGANTPTLFVKYLDGNRANAEGFVVASVNSTAYSLELNNDISQVDDHYNGKVIKIVGGPGKGQQRKILDYIANSTVRTVVLNEALSTNPTTESRFQIYDTTDRFVLGDRLFEVGNPGVVANVALTVPSGTVTGNASAVGVDEGIYYTRGTFVRTEPQFMILDPYSTKPTNIIGLNITESIVRSQGDTSLLDPAQGSFNYTAPGADRWKIALTLDKKAVRSNANVASNNFIELMRVEDGSLTKVVEFPRYNKIGEEMARRTFDESGNYTVRPFKLNFQEFVAEAKGVIASATGTTIRLDDENLGTQRGQVSANNDFYNGQKLLITGRGSPARGLQRDITDYNGSTTTVTTSAAFSSNPSANDDFIIFNDDKYVASLSQGKAYVEGFEFSTIGTNHLTMDRARDTLQVDNADIFNQMGNFIRIDAIGPRNNAITGMSQFDPTDFSTVHLHYVPQNSIDISGTHPYQNSVIGTARVRQLTDSGSSSTDNAGFIYNLHLFDIRISNTQTGTVSQANSDLKTVLLANNLSSPAIDDVYNGATITVTNPGGTPDEHVISDYDGSRRMVTLATNLQAQTQPGSTYSISFGTKNIRSVSIPDNPAAVTKLKVSANVALSGHVDSNYAANTKIRDTGQNKLVLRMPHNVIKTVRNSSGAVEAEYRFQRTFSGVSFSSGVGTISTADGTERFVGTGTTLGDTLKRNHFIVRVTDEGTSAFTCGQIIDMTAASRTITVPTPSVGAVGTASMDAQDSGNFTATVIASIDDNLAGEKTKTLVSANVTSQFGTVAKGQIAIASPNQLSESVDTLRVSDVFELKKVVDSLDPNIAVSTAMMTNSQHFITNKYTLDSGQRDNFYDHGTIKLNSGTKPPTGQILACFDYFSHSGGKGYFNVDSYTNIEYENIPAYTSPTTGQVYELRDSIDFRPRRQDSSLSNTAFVIEGGQMPLSGTAIQLDYQFYLARIDKLAVNAKDLNFLVIKGESAELPVTPPDRNGCMTLYTLELPAYTFSTEDIVVRPNLIKRYTMGDIGDLDKRLNRVEYYTALNSLEKSAENATILDSAGLDRFKNGIVVDNFTGHSVSDVKNPDLNISVDPLQQELRPFFTGGTTGRATYYPNDTGSGNRPVLNDGLIMLPFTEEEYVSQPLASRSIMLNPFNQVAWVGTMKLIPERDDFVATNKAPDVNVNVAGDHDAWAAMTGEASKKFGTEWGAWETKWTGVQRSDLKNRTSSSRSGNYVTTKTFKRTKVTTTNKQVKEGIKTTVNADLQTESLGERIVDISVVPYIRSQDISFTAKGLKPNTRYYPFFDEVPVATTTKPTDGAFGDKLTSNDKGVLTGVFNIPDPNTNVPRTSILKKSGSSGFRVGERMFQVIDDPYGRPEVATSYSEALFVASGLQTTKETTNLTTRVPKLKKKTLQKNRVVTSKVVEEKLIGTSKVYSPPPPPPFTGGDGRDGPCGGRNGNKGNDPCGSSGSSGSHCCTASHKRGEMSLTEVRKLRAWHRNQNVIWQEGYDVWGKIIADHLVMKSKWQSDRVRDFYYSKIYGKTTLGSIYADIVIYPGSYIVGTYKLLKHMSNKFFVKKNKVEIG